MKKILRYAFVLLVVGYGIEANAQNTKLVLDDMTKVGNYSPMRWKYETVTCTSGNNITSIIVSMKNNDIISNSSSVFPSGTPNVSLGVNPKTILYLFTPAITETQVAEFIKGMTFEQTNDVPGENPWVDITIDANPTRLPSGATITVWRDHPDGSTHYYVWVASNKINYGPAYNAAKTYYFQGMRGYLPTITSEDESKLLTEISEDQGWSGGARTATTIDDTKNEIVNPVRSNSNTVSYLGNIYRWLCGPETNFQYFQGPARSSTNGGPMNGAYDGWNDGEPNDVSGGENCMEVNHNNLKWNDYYANNTNIRGYFIEFGGTGKEYKVGNATYTANDKYNEDKLIIPSGGLTNDQWEGFSKGNRASTSTTFKPNSMRANVLVIE